MKVGTDAVLLGAWTPLKRPKTALDIGTGSGLLALMLAQRQSDLEIDAIEIDAKSALQAKENVERSPFSDRIRVIHADFRQEVKNISKKYDLIICNPPYFQNSFKPENKSRSTARHRTQLDITNLLEGVSQILSVTGLFTLILPMKDSMEFKREASRLQLHPVKQLTIVPVPGKAAIRLCMAFSREKIPMREESILIEAGGRHSYSNEYKKLTKDFYLDF